jgi:hypothetical protein
MNDWFAWLALSKSGTAWLWKISYLRYKWLVGLYGSLPANGGAVTRKNERGKKL